MRSTATSPTTLEAASRRELPVSAESGPVVAVTQVVAPHVLSAGEKDGEQEALDDSVASAVKKGFARGFTSGIQTEMAPRAASSAVDRPAPRDDLPAVPGLSAVSMIAQMADYLDPPASGLSQDALDARMDRFPELRGVEVLTGNVARFPELAEPDPVAMNAAPQGSVAVPEDAYSR